MFYTSEHQHSHLKWDAENIRLERKLRRKLNEQATAEFSDLLQLK